MIHLRKDLVTSDEAEFTETTEQALQLSREKWEAVVYGLFSGDDSMANVAAHAGIQSGNCALCQRFNGYLIHPGILEIRGNACGGCPLDPNPGACGVGCIRNPFVAFEIKVNTDDWRVLDLQPLALNMLNYINKVSGIPEITVEQITEFVTAQKA